MADICHEAIGNKEQSQPDESSKSTRRRIIEMPRPKDISNPTTTLPPPSENVLKRQRLMGPYTPPHATEAAIENRKYDKYEEEFMGPSHVKEMRSLSENGGVKYGTASVCGRRREMEDSVCVLPSFWCMKKDEGEEDSLELHYFGVYDGHGCSHVAMICGHRLHELVKEELVKGVENFNWKNVMGRSFLRMDEEVIAWNKTMVGATCRCELRSPECDTVGSTAVVVVVTPQQIVVANCGDSRAVLCRNGQAVPLSNDHKPDHPDERSRIQAAGGRVIYWDGARVQGVLATSRAIGDNYLKPYVICDPDVTVMERSEEDDCLILASDGLWDVVSNDTACNIARMCLKGKVPGMVALCSCSSGTEDGSGGSSDRACWDASTLLTKLALARRSADNVSVVVIDLRKDT